MERENRSSVIKSTVRRRIIMHADSKDLVIYEGKLADEFGVSRTPIRQVIQALASERLVEVRSGVGTIASPLRPERRVNDMKSFSSVLRACAECSTNGNINIVMMELSSLLMFLEQSDNDQASEVFFDVANKFASCMTEIIEDQILRDALIASYWRYIRRRLEDVEGDYGVAIAEMRDLIKSAVDGGQGGQADQLLRLTGATVEEVTRKAVDRG